MKRRPAHTPPVLSPTAYGCASAVLGAGLYLAAVQTGSDACMAGALAILLSHIVSFGVALSAFLDEKWRGKPERAPRAARMVHRIARASADRHARVTYDRIDQAGRVVATLTLGLPPRERGVYQASDKLVTTTGPLWLWRSNARAAMDGELLRPPSNVDASDAAGAATLAQDGPGARVASELDTSLVRPYQRGDQVNAIAWRQTAHHGRLMSYERRRIAHARVLVVPDTSSATSPADADALASHTLAIWESIQRSGRTGSVRLHAFLADGEVQLDDDASVFRYCAALYPEPSQGATDARARAHRVVDTAHAVRAGQIIFITVDENSQMAHVLAASDLAHTVTAIEAKATAQDKDKQESADTDADTDASANAGTDAVQAQSHPIARALYGVLIGAATFYPLLLLVQTMGKLFSPGEWNMTALYAFGLACAEAALMEALSSPPAARARRASAPRRIHVPARQTARIALLAATTVALLVLGTVTARQTLNQRADFALSKQIYEQPAMLGSLQLSGPITPIINIVIIGVSTLYYGQWVPINVGFVGDAALVIIWCAIAMALRPLLLSRRARPLVAAAPLIAQAAAFLLMGDAAHLPQAGTAILCGLTLAALSHPPKNVRRADAPKTKGFLVHIITSASIAGMVAIGAAAIAPAAISVSPASPFEIIPQQGIFSNSAINPVLDLKRDLTRPGKSIALTYRADVAQTGASDGRAQTYGPLYLRLATLGSFNSGTWVAGQDAAATGVALDEASPALSAFADAERLNSAAIGEVKTVRATISLDNVSSAHLPVPSNSFNITLADVMNVAGEQERDNARAAMEKLTWSQDGGAGTRDGSTVPKGLSYTATCAYQAPVSQPDQLDQIASIAGHLNAQVVAQEDGDTSALSQEQPDRGYLYLDQALPDELQEFVDTARANGIAEVPAIRRDTDASLRADGLTARQAAQIAVMRYLMDYFANGDFSYSLDAPDGNGSNNLQIIANLLQERRGYCVHYASALAVLGRALGVPTRLVLGYRANADGASTSLESGVEVVTYQATNHDLHAWTEAYIDNVGWVSFDVTPAIGQSGPALDAPVGEEANQPADQEDDQNTPDSSDTGPSDNDAPFASKDGDANDDASSLLPAIAETLSSVAAKLAGLLPYACGVLVAAAAALSPALLRRARKARRMHAVRRASSDPARAIASAWAEATDAALDAGITWSPCDTEEDISRSIASALDDTAATTALFQISRGMCTMRYGGGSLAVLANDLSALLGSVLAAIDACARRTDGARNAMARANRRLLPASLFAQRHIRQR